jgi:hypothetical protein
MDFTTAFRLGIEERVVPTILQEHDFKTTKLSYAEANRFLGHLENVDINHILALETSKVNPRVAQVVLELTTRMKFAIESMPSIDKHSIDLRKLFNFPNKI